MSESKRKLKLGDRVEQGIPSWLSAGGGIIFGSRLPLRSPDEAQITVGEVKPVDEMTSDVNELEPSDTKERTPDP